jgi:hypothetical protein
MELSPQWPNYYPSSRASSNRLRLLFALDNDFRDDDFMREMMHLGQEAKNPGNVPPAGDPIIFDQIWGTLDAECI